MESGWWINHEQSGGEESTLCSGTAGKRHYLKKVKTETDASILPAKKKISLTSHHKRETHGSLTKILV